MSRQRSGRTILRTVGCAALVGAAVLAAGTPSAGGGRTGRVKQNLTATSMAPDARGKARVLVRSSSSGKFAVIAKRLTGNTQYDVIVAGVKVGALHTSPGGSGRILFKTRPGPRHSLLGFDPRGHRLTLRDADDGDDVLVGDIPDDDPASVACCLPEGDDDEGEFECEEKSPEECTAAGGTSIGVPGGTTGASCLPNPCDTTPPADHVVCCTNESHDDESEAECETQGSEHDCAEEGGAVVAAASCDPNPCQGTPPSNAAACCLSEHEDDGEVEMECEVISAEACSAAGGTAAGVASCHDDPCGGDDGDDGHGGGDDGGDDDGGGEDDD
jgi:hypothetical protein